MRSSCDAWARNRRRAFSELRLRVKASSIWRQHGVQGKPEAAHLGARVGALDAAREVAGGDGAGGGRHVVERAQLAAHDPPGERAEPDQDEEGDARLDEQQTLLGLDHLGQRDRGDERVRGPLPTLVTVSASTRNCCDERTAPVVSVVWPPPLVTLRVRPSGSDGVADSPP